MSRRITVEIDPSLLVGAERYAIHRWLTAASELTASSILDNVDQLVTDKGCAAAIVYDIIDLLKDRDPPDLQFGSIGEYVANRERWKRVAEAILARIDQPDLEHRFAEAAG
jgi:hypothetical protein